MQIVAMLTPIDFYDYLAGLADEIEHISIDGSLPSEMIAPAQSPFAQAYP